MPRLIYHLLGVPPHKVDNIEQIVEAMTQSMWEFLHDRYVLIFTFDLASSNHYFIANTFIH